MKDDSLLNYSIRTNLNMSSGNKYLSSSFGMNSFSNNFKSVIKHQSSNNSSLTKRPINLNYFSGGSNIKKEFYCHDNYNYNFRKNNHKKISRNFEIDNFNIQIMSSETANEINLNLVNENVKLREENINLLEMFNTAKKKIEGELLLKFTQDFNALKHQIKIYELKIHNLKNENSKSLLENEELKRIISDLKKNKAEIKVLLEIKHIESFFIESSAPNLVRCETNATNNTYNCSTKFHSYHKNLSYVNYFNHSVINDIGQHLSPIRKNETINDSKHQITNSFSLYLKKRTCDNSLVVNRNKKKESNQRQNSFNNTTFKKIKKITTELQYENEVAKTENDSTKEIDNKVKFCHSPNRIIEKKLNFTSKSFYSKSISFQYKKIDKKESKGRNNTIIESSQSITDSDFSCPKNFANFLKGEDLPKVNYLFRVHPSKKNTLILFDLNSKGFKCQEFKPKNFPNEKNPFSYNNFFNGSTMSTILSVENGTYIITGERYKHFYHYDNKTHLMAQLKSLNFSHCKSILIPLFEKTPNETKLICISGTANSSVEEYSIKENVWKELPDLNYSRAEASSLIKNKKDIYVYFGYDYLNLRYVQSIEWMNINSQNKWNVIDIKLEIKCHASFALGSKEDEVFIVGGKVKDGREMDNMDLIEILRNDNTFSILKSSKRINTIKSKNQKGYYFREFMRDFFDKECSTWKKCVIDTEGNAHLIEYSTLKHKVYNFNE